MKERGLTKHCAHRKSDALRIFSKLVDFIFVYVLAGIFVCKYAEYYWGK